jgi:hypothetical protein
MRAAQPLDVEAVARHEVAQPLDLLERAFEPAGAAPHHPAFLALHLGLERTGAVSGELELARALRTLLGHIAQDLRDDVAGALHDHHVALAHVQPLDLVGIVQGGARHHHAADIDRLEIGDGCQRAGAADLDEDVLQPRTRLFGRKLVGHRPARRATHEAQALLPVDSIDLVDDAVDVIGQRRPLHAHLAIEFPHLLGRPAQLG